MPTGSGKTRVAMSLICTHLRSLEPTLVIWLAHSEELCEQAAQEFQVSWEHLGDREVQLHRFWGPHNLDPIDVHDGIVVAGLSKLFSAAKSKIAFIDALRMKTSLVVMDEAHQSIAETYNTLLDVLLSSPASALLGLTATPGRTWNEPAEDEKLAKYFARQKVTLRVSGYDNPVRYLIDEGYLAQPMFNSVLYNPGIELTPEDISAVEAHFDIPDRVLEKLQSDEQRNLAILRCIESLATRHQRILVFAASVEHSNLLAAVSRARGAVAVSLTGTTGSEERARVIADFRSDSHTTMILFNFGVLTAGFDAPRTSAAVIARPTRSLVLFSQMVGRAIRGPKAKGNATAEVMIVQDPQLPGFGDIAAAFMNWEDVWNHG
jgi:superfamily II DNA or RNA helicase